MKNFKKITIITLIISSVSVGIGLYILYSSGSNLKDFAVVVERFINMKNINIKKVDIIKINEEYSYDLKDETELYIDSKISDINIKTSDSDDLKIKVNGTINKGYYSDYLNINKNNNKFEIKVLNNANKNISILNLGKLSIEVILPKNRFKNINLTTVSGGILTNDFYVESLKVDSISGDLHLDKTTVNELTCNIVSGNLYSKGTVGKINCDSVSGNISLSDIETAKIKTLSGNIDIYYKNLLDKSSLDTISGDINARFKTFDDMSIGIESVSGDLMYSDNIINKNRFHEMFSQNNDNGNVLNIQTVSGSVNIVDKN